MGFARFEFFCPQSEAELELTRLLFLEYAAELNVDLCFQGFERELSELPGCYGEPGGGLLLARSGDRVVGCCAFRPLHVLGHTNACEMKRLYVKRDFRGLGLGRQLAERILDLARLKGYTNVLLDTLEEMKTARALYGGLGFVEVPPYYRNPIPGVRYLKANLAVPPEGPL